MSNKFKPLNSYLQSSGKLATIHEKLQQNQAILELIQKLLPHPLNQHCVGLVAKPDLLILYADSSAWASRIRYFSHDLAEKLRHNQLFFSKIRVKVALDNRSKIKESHRRGTKRLSAKDSDHLQKVASHTTDSDLRAALMRLSSHRRN